MGLCSALVGACLVCSALVGACLVCSALVGACLVCSALVGACLVCSALVGACLICSALVGACLVSADLPESPHVSADLPESPHVTAVYPVSLHVSAVLSTCPGGLLSHWPHMDLALRSLPRFHLRSTALLDYALCEASGSRPLWGGALSRIWLPLTTLQLHITHGLHLPSFTALTHSHPPLHQSQSCHQSLINPDCFTTPASHSHTHI